MPSHEDDPDDWEESTYEKSGFPMLVCDKCGGPAKLTEDGIYCPACAENEELS